MFYTVLLEYNLPVAGFLKRSLNRFIPIINSDIIAVQKAKATKHETKATWGLFSLAPAVMEHLAEMFTAVL